MTLGEQIRLLRQEQDLTLREFGDRTGISVTYLSDIERGRTRPSGNVIAKIAEAFGVDIDLLCRRAFREREPNPALIQFAREAELSSEEVAMLAELSYRGKQPWTVAGYRFLWDALRLVCGGTLEEKPDA